MNNVLTSLFSPSIANVRENNWSLALKAVAINIISLYLPWSVYHFILSTGLKAEFPDWQSKWREHTLQLVYVRRSFLLICQRATIPRFSGHNASIYLDNMLRDLLNLRTSVIAFVWPNKSSYWPWVRFSLLGYHSLYTLRSTISSLVVKTFIYVSSSIGWLTRPNRIHTLVLLCSPMLQ